MQKPHDSAVGADSISRSNVIRQMLTPIVRLFIRWGVDFVGLTTLLREVYVDVANEPEFQITDKNGNKKENTTARLSVLTGLTRREITRLLEKSDEVGGTSALEEVADTSGRILKLIDYWKSDHSRTAGGEELISYDQFKELARKAGCDVTPRALLDELLKLKMISKQKATDKKTVLYKLDRDHYVPEELDKKIVEACLSIFCMANTVAHNLLPDLEKAHDQFELKILKTELSYEQVKNLEGFQKEFRAKAWDLLKKTDEHLAYVEPAGSSDDQFAAGVGIYYTEWRMK